VTAGVVTVVVGTVLVVVVVGVVLVVTGLVAVMAGVVTVGVTGVVITGVATGAVNKPPGCVITPEVDGLTATATIQLLKVRVTPGAIEGIATAAKVGGEFAE
jgi:hypothetical protein